MHTTCKWGEICPLLLTHLCEHSGAQHTVKTQWAAMDGARGAGWGSKVPCSGELRQWT